MALSEIQVNDIKKSAFEEGFQAVEVAPVPEVSIEFQTYYTEYLKRGYHAGLGYLENRKNIDAKFDVNKIFYGVKTVAAFLYSYRNDEVKEKIDDSKYQISRYAWGRDYHNVLKKKVNRICSGVESYRVVCDTTPLPEKYIGASMSLGFCGKNSLLIHPEFGSYTLLAFALFTEELESSVYYTRGEQKNRLNLGNRQKQLNTGSQNYVFEGNQFSEDAGNLNTIGITSIAPRFEECGSCRKCIDACPGKALSDTGYLDSNKCYSYWSIESVTQKIPLSGNWGNRIFGCDICQEVCPFNAPDKHDANKTDPYDVISRIRHPDVGEHLTQTGHQFTGEHNNLKPQNEPVNRSDVISKHHLPLDFYPNEVSLKIANGEFNLEDADLRGTALKRRGLSGLKINQEFINS